MPRDQIRGKESPLQAKLVLLFSFVQAAGMSTYFIKWVKIGHCRVLDSCQVLKYINRQSEKNIRADSLQELPWRTMAQEAFFG